MKRKNILAAFAALALCASVASCTDGDVTKPVINLIEPEEGQLIQIGSDHGMHFEMDLEDNEALGSYKRIQQSLLLSAKRTTSITTAMPTSIIMTWSVRPTPPLATIT